MHIGITHELIPFLNRPQYKRYPTPRKQTHVVTHPCGNRHPAHAPPLRKRELPSLRPLAMMVLEIALVNLDLCTVLHVVGI